MGDNSMTFNVMGGVEDSTWRKRMLLVKYELEEIGVKVKMSAVAG